MFNISPLDKNQHAKIQQTIDNKTKPPGSLGQLETLALQLRLITSKETIQLSNPHILVFAGDHGIAEENISIAPSAVTEQMVNNFLHGGAAINCFCRTHNINLKVIDAGVLNTIEHDHLISQPIGNGTRNFSKEPAMTLSDVERGIQLGSQVVQSLNDCNVIGFGEMGIGNTTSASAILAAIKKLPVEQCVGRGTGISDSALDRKITLVAHALSIHKDHLNTPMEILASLGGYEIVQMVGAMLASAEHRKVLLIDGFIATAAALICCELDPNCRDYMVFCHRSSEHAHQIMLEHLKAIPLLDLELRLGEGTGAALAYPLLKSAEAFYNNMASFSSAGVDSV